MQFKEWLKINEINKGVKRTFMQQNPHLPNYVANQVLQNRIGPLWKNMQSGMVKLGAENPLKSMYQDTSVVSISGNRSWKLIRGLNLHITDFMDDNIHSFLSQQFGSSPILSGKVRNHPARMAIQIKLANQNKDSNEPIVLTKEGNKYSIREGWHRLYARFLQSMPPEEMEKVMNSRMNEIDFSKWPNIVIDAWVGENNQSLVSPTDHTKQVSGTETLAATLA